MIPRVGVIGGGKFGEMHLRAFNQLQREGKAELVGLADINPELLIEREKQYGVAGFTDYMEMIEETDPHGVTVVTPDFLHRKIAAGVHQNLETGAPVELSDL